MSNRSNSSTTCWKSAFEELTGHVPLPWQERLYEKLVAGEAPRQVDIPTGLGKTMVIVLWLLALVEQRQSGPQVKPLPRRLCYVVNRRTIVDQSTEVVETLREKILNAKKDEGHPLRGLYDTLNEMAVASDGEPLAVSTLRGELADNRLWREDPTRPAIVIGTIDMIGSKLLFSGYGDSHRVRPLHSGLLGCDTLFIHDEAHLTPAFGKLLLRVRDVQNGDGDETVASLPKMEVMELSATLRGGDKDGSTVFGLSNEDRKNKIVKERIHAVKKLYLHPLEKGGKVLQDEVVRRALAYNEKDKAPQRVIIFVQSPIDATKIVSGLQKSLGKESEDRIALLTGQIRGYERDKLLKTPAMEPFLSGNHTEELEKTVYLVSTSAGEVGMDLHADHAICDLTTFDSMIQRLGRVNRFGSKDDLGAQVDVLYEQALDDKEVKGDLKVAVQATLKVFQEKIDGPDGFMDASPAALRAINVPDNAFSPEPDTVELTDILQDFWSQTSINDVPGRPEVAPWLHGLVDDLPETWIAWREEVSVLLNSETVSNKDLTLWFRAHPISSVETLQKPTYQFRNLFQNKSRESTAWVAELCKKDAQLSVILLSASGEAKKIKLQDLVRQPLEFATVVFPVKLGRLSESGAFDEKAKEKVRDVANKPFRRVLLKRDGATFTWQFTGETKSREREGSWTSLSQATRDIANHTKKQFSQKLVIQEAEEGQDDDEVTQAWLLLLKTPNDKRKADQNGSPTVDEHNADVANLAQQMAVALDLREPLIEAFRIAGQYHDAGKSLKIWQKAAGYDPDEKGFQPRAKPASGGVDWRKLGGYRHELDSLIKAERIEEVINHPERDLILHLIATHHGWARPHFPAKAFEYLPATTGRGSLENEPLQDLMLRYVALQERFGHWRLAWLESLLRRADGIASAQYSNDTEEAS